MKKCLGLFLIFVLHTSAFAQTGEGATQSTETGSENRWQNWVFAAGALIVAAGGLTAVAINNGESVSTSSH